MPDPVNVQYLETANVVSVVPVSSTSSNCWHLGTVDPVTGNYKHSCYDAQGTDLVGCDLDVTFTGGLVRRYHFACMVTEAQAGYVQKSGSTITIYGYATVT